MLKVHTSQMLADCSSVRRGIEEEPVLVSAIAPVTDIARPVPASVRVRVQLSQNVQDPLRRYLHPCQTASRQLYSASQARAEVTSNLSLVSMVVGAE